MQQATLPGGHGIRSAVQLAPWAYLTLTAASTDLIQPILPFHLHNVPLSKSAVCASMMIVQQQNYYTMCMPVGSGDLRNFIFGLFMKNCPRKKFWLAFVKYRYICAFPIEMLNPLYRNNNLNPKEVLTMAMHTFAIIAMNQLRMLVHIGNGLW